MPPLARSVTSCWRTTLHGPQFPSLWTSDIRESLFAMCLTLETYHIQSFCSQDGCQCGTCHISSNSGEAGPEVEEAGCAILFCHGTSRISQGLVMCLPCNSCYCHCLIQCASSCLPGFHHSLFHVQSVFICLTRELFRRPTLGCHDFYHPAFQQPLPGNDECLHRLCPSGSLDPHYYSPTPPS